ncbi:MAG: hypothetical protein E7657_02535 [Ruminococcaceae bacterium]|nr:hypothetical protein [Oscillospiraceae bacterium]
MKKIVSLLLVAVMLVGMIGTLSGCGKKNAEIRIYVGDQIYDFDPTLAFVDDNATRIMSLIYEPLFLLKENGDVAPGLAESYKIIEDEEKGIYQMEIQLRETYWNDGKNKVLADDLYFAWKRILEPGFKSQAAPLLYDVKNATRVKQGDASPDEIGLESNKDVFTITFEGKIDYEAFLRNLTSVALSPIRETKVGKATEPDTEYWAKSVAHIATNGPFAIRSWNKLTGEFTLQKNEYYHVSESNIEDGKKTKDVTPSFLQMQWTDENFEADYMDDMNAFLDDTFNNLYSLTDVAEKAIFCVGAMPMDKDLRLEYFEDAEIFDALSTYSFVFNTSKAPFDNENVRRALSMVIDREYLAEELVFAKPADGLISPAVWDSVKKKVSFRSQHTGDALINTKATDAEFEAAIALLDDVDTSAPIVLTVRDTVEERFIAEYVAEKWSELGFDVETNYVLADTEVWAKVKGEPGRDADIGVDKLVTVLDDGIQAAYISGEFDVLGMDYNMYSTNALTALCGFTTLWNGNGLEYVIDEEGENPSTSEIQLHCSGFSDPAYDAIIERALAEKDLTKRAAILHEAEAYLLSKMPIVPVLYNQNYYVVEKLGGLDFDGYGNPVFTHARLKANVPTEEAPAKKED